MSEEKKENKVAIKQLSVSERFTNKVVQEFTSTAGGASSALTAFHKRLCQNYFINVDMSLKKAETNRLRKSEKFREELPVTWDNINMNQLALDVVACARVGLDPSLSNQVHVIPYKNNHTKKYDITLMPGYRGKEIVAKKYGLEIPDDVIVELVYTTDEFKPIKKDVNNKIEAYEFNITDPDNRGEVRGGFYYHIFDENPRKNRLMYYTLAQLEKRKPAYASPEFWGGEKDKWIKDSQGNSKKSGKEKVEGWTIEMLWKTIYRAAYNSITIDSQKIDDDFMRLSTNEKDYAVINSQEEIDQNANKEEMGFEDVEEVKEEVNEETQPEEKKEPEPKKQKEDKQPIQQTIQTDKPSF